MGTDLRKLAVGMFLGVGVSAVGRDDVADPTERSACAQPETRREEQPQNTGQNSTVVKLPDTGNNQTQNTCQNWIAHRLSYLPQWKQIR